MVEEADEEGPLANQMLEAVDQWTLLMAVFGVANIALAVVSGERKEDWKRSAK